MELCTYEGKFLNLPLQWYWKHPRELGLLLEKQIHLPVFHMVDDMFFLHYDLLTLHFLKHYMIQCLKLCHDDLMQYTVLLAETL